DVSAYKPSPAHFRHFASSISPETWIHVAQSYFHDIKPASALGITRIWVNRQGEKDDPSLASAVVGDLADLPAAVHRLLKGSPRKYPTNSEATP
ncbi:MAG TPA: hypothetical protein VGR34_05255, partial [Candidatus Dormibacteraeota bacterium]|nr:hypothetical protein [Candidatus Dormibacteraeota bacterium]